MDAGTAIPVVALTSAAILAGVRWLRKEEGRQALKEFVCRHDWQPLDMGGDGIVRITPDSHECTKCGARRSE